MATNNKALEAAAERVIQYLYENAPLFKGDDDELRQVVMGTYVKEEEKKE